MDALRIMFDWIKVLTQFESSIFEEIKPILANRSYWFHSENLILSVLSDPQREVRSKDVKRIKQIRNDKNLNQWSCAYLEGIFL